MSSVIYEEIEPVIRLEEGMLKNELITNNECELIIDNLDHKVYQLIEKNQMKTVMLNKVNKRHSSKVEERRLLFEVYYKNIFNDYNSKCFLFDARKIVSR